MFPEGVGHLLDYGSVSENFPIGYVEAHVCFFSPPLYWCFMLAALMMFHCSLKLTV